jgi:hypothetical protein
MAAAELDAAERRHIRRLREAGARLLNIATGGLSGCTWRMAPESVRKSAMAKMGKPRSLETREKLAAANRGKKSSAESRRKQGDALRGKGQSPDWVAKRVAAIAATKAAKPQAVECPQGHAWTEENTRWYKGSRNCRACARERSRLSRAAAPPKPRRPRKPVVKLREQVFAEIDRGAEVTASSISALTGQSLQGAYSMLSVACKEGIVERVGRGVYRVRADYFEAA